ncbi:MAG: UDP-3-O-acyl-N-acetylglucosamine deacetylase [Planctomycetota bacterium]|nr:UDP-3-O-acyl-N-acetylglucosamine deacetylase [Planctomycetota bacterium]
MSRQRTINKPVSVEGRGLFSGVASRLEFRPAPTDSGLVFVRGDSSAPVRILTDIANLANRDRRTSLANSSWTVETVEHVLAAVYGLQIDNLFIEVSGEETPDADGSSLLFVEALQSAGIAEQDAERDTFVISEPVAVAQDDASLAALPGSPDCLDILYDLDYSAVPSIGRQVFTFRLGRDDFAATLAAARTFLLAAEAEELQARGWGRHLSTSDILVMAADGPIDNKLRFPDEHVRHKICDLIGDLALLGRPLCGRIVATKSGHDLNQMLIRKISEQLIAQDHAQSMAGEPIMDIRSIMRLLPHRYPFLMVDRILEIEGDRKAVAVKNVSINEPFFQGHYPGQPIMPGVMILESMAQLSGILLSQRLEHTGKVAVLLSMDRVKMRRPVRPGDQLIIQAEMLHVRTRTGHCRCRASVADELAAEAEIKFMLVDAEPA